MGLNSKKNDNFLRAGFFARERLQSNSAGILSNPINFTDPFEGVSSMLNRRSYFACVLFLAIFVSGFSSAIFAQSDTLHLVGLKGKVTVTRDERGIPYTEATNDEDLNFAQGYITASDRLWQMDVLRRTTRGEMSDLVTV